MSELADTSRFNSPSLMCDVTVDVTSVVADPLPYEALTIVIPVLIPYYEENTTFATPPRTRRKLYDSTYARTL